MNKINRDTFDKVIDELVKGKHNMFLLKSGKIPKNNYYKLPERLIGNNVLVYSSVDLAYTEILSTRTSLLYGTILDSVNGNVSYHEDDKVISLRLASKTLRFNSKEIRFIDLKDKIKLISLKKPQLYWNVLSSLHQIWINDKLTLWQQIEQIKEKEREFCEGEEIKSNKLKELLISVYKEEYKKVKHEMSTGKYDDYEYKRYESYLNDGPMWKSIILSEYEYFGPKGCSPGVKWSEVNESSVFFERKTVNSDIGRFNNDEKVMRVFPAEPYWKIMKKLHPIWFRKDLSMEEKEDKMEEIYREYFVGQKETPVEANRTGTLLNKEEQEELIINLKEHVESNDKITIVLHADDILSVWLKDKTPKRLKAFGKGELFGGNKVLWELFEKLLKNKTEGIIFKGCKIPDKLKSQVKRLNGLLFTKLGLPEIKPIQCNVCIKDAKGNYQLKNLKLGKFYLKGDETKKYISEIKLINKAEESLKQFEEENDCPSLYEPLLNTGKRVDTRYYE